MRDVCFSCDDNGAKFLRVTVWSLLKHYQGDEPLRINIFEGFGGHSAESKRILAEVVAKFPNASIRYIDFSPYLGPVGSTFDCMLWAFTFIGKIMPPDVTGQGKTDIRAVTDRISVGTVIGWQFDGHYHIRIDRLPGEWEHISILKTKPRVMAFYDTLGVCDTDAFKVGEWTELTVKTAQADGKVTFTVLIDGKECLTAVDEAPSGFLTSESPSRRKTCNLFLEEAAHYTIGSLYFNVV